MRALSLLQPWATLVAVGVKRVETRTWRGNVRPGETIAIHASAGRAPWRVETDVLTWAMAHDMEFPRGAIVATCRVLRVEQATVEPSAFMREFVPDLVLERRLGDWTPGRWLWALEAARKTSPIPCRGMLGLWRVPAPIEAFIAADGLA